MNWGGFRGATCRAPDQDILLTCGEMTDETLEPTALPTLEPSKTPTVSPTEEPVQAPTEEPTKGVDPNKLCKSIDSKKTCKSFVTSSGPCSWDNKKSKCSFKSCEDYSNKKWKCPKVAKKAGLECFWNKYDGECTNVNPGYDCEDFDDKKACKKWSKFHGNDNCKYEKETKSCLTK